MTTKPRRKLKETGQNECLLFWWATEGLATAFFRLSIGRKRLKFSPLGQDPDLNLSLDGRIQAKRSRGQIEQAGYNVGIEDLAVNLLDPWSIELGEFTGALVKPAEDSKDPRRLTTSRQWVPMVRPDSRNDIDSPRVVLQPPQFRLRTMLWVMALICGLLTVMVAIGMAWALGLLMLILMIGAHVVGNAVGTRLRDGSDAPADTNTPIFDPFGEQADQSRERDTSWRAIKSHRMQEKLPISWLFMLLAAAGAIGGGIVGGMIAFSVYGEQLSWVSASTAIVASGIMGGIAAFVTGTFIDMVRRVWRDAVTEQSPFKEGS